MEEDGAAESQEALAREALDVTRSSLMLSFRFLDRALLKMPSARRGGVDVLGTDGSSLLFHPKGVLERFLASPDELARDYLHAILHCLFCHPFVGGIADASLWDVAADAVVEECCLELAGSRFASPLDARRRETLSAMRRRYGALSAEKLYRRFRDEGSPVASVEELRTLFERDSHAPWHDRPRFSVKTDGSSGGERVAARFGTIAVAGGPLSAAEGEDGEGEPSEGEAGGAGEPLGPEEASPAEEALSRPAAESPREKAAEAEAKRAWEETSAQVALDVETRSREAGAEEGALSWQLAHVNRRRTDYRAFLRRFSEPSEEMRLSDVDFDPVYYTYGLSLYGNMPLVEPLEYRESLQVRDFVVAIDTSASVAGSLVRRFVEETFAVLSSAGSFSERVEVHVVQCDRQVRRDDVLRSRRDFEELMEGFSIEGGGGTDFRPVFDYVEELRGGGALPNLRGLVYFTDGHGAYPPEPPPYDVAFVFVGDDAYRPQVPAWAFQVAYEPDALAEAGERISLEEPTRAR